MNCVDVHCASSPENKHAYDLSRTLSKPFPVQEGRLTSDNCPQVMSHESALTWGDDYWFLNKKNIEVGVDLQGFEFFRTLLSAPHLCCMGLQTMLVAISKTQPKLGEDSKKDV